MPIAFSYVFCIAAEKAALLRRKNAFGRTTAFLAPRMPSQNKKAIPYGMTFCFGGDKRDRTADLMTASCGRFVISGNFEYNTSVQSAKNAIFYRALRIVSTRFHAHLGHNLGQGSWANSGGFQTEPTWIVAWALPIVKS